MEICPSPALLVQTPNEIKEINLINYSFIETNYESQNNIKYNIKIYNIPNQIVFIIKQLNDFSEKIYKKIIILLSN